MPSTRYVPVENSPGPGCTIKVGVHESRSTSSLEPNCQIFNKIFTDLPVSLCRNARPIERRSYGVVGSFRLLGLSLALSLALFRAVKHLLALFF
jgi:hypothetical protein